MRRIIPTCTVEILMFQLMSKLMSELMCYEKDALRRNINKDVNQDVNSDINVFFLNTKSTKETKILFVLCIPCSNEN